MLLWSLATCLLLTTGGWADKNVTVDDFDKRIEYNPSIDVWWVEKNRFVLDRMGQTIHYTNQVGASASFTFNNTKVFHFFSYGISEITPANFPVTLDDGTEVQSFTADANTPADRETSALIWTSPDLDPAKEYTFTVTKTTDTLSYDLNIDAFILVQPDEPVSVSTSGTSTSPDPAESTGTRGSDSLGSNNGNGGGGTKVPIGAIIGTTLGGLALILIFLFFLIRHLTRHRARPQERVTIEAPWSIPQQPQHPEGQPYVLPTAGQNQPPMGMWKPPLTTTNSSSDRRPQVPTSAGLTAYNSAMGSRSDGFGETLSSPSSNSDGPRPFSFIQSTRSPPPAYPNH